MVEHCISVLVILLATSCDAWRDAWLRRSWWPRHIAKWFSFYVPIVHILWTGGFFVPSHESVFNLVVLAIISFVLWKVIYFTFKN